MGRGQKTTGSGIFTPQPLSMKWRGGLKGERVKEFLFYPRSSFIHQSGEEPKNQRR